MRSLNENISQLEIDLKAKGSVQDASRIEEFMGTLAWKEYVEHKLIVYQTCARYLKREVLEISEIIQRSDGDEASWNWYSVTSLYDHRALYNPIEEEIERLINPTTGFLEEAIPALAQETGKLRTDFNAATANYDVFVNTNSEYLEEVPPLKEKKNFGNGKLPKSQSKMEPGTADNPKSLNESVLLAEVSNLSILLEDRTDDTKIKVELNNCNRSSLARAKFNISNPTSVESKWGAKRKDKKVECIKRVKGKGKESAASKPKVASVAQLCGSRILHIIRSKNDPSKIHGYILLKDTQVLDNPNIVSLILTKQVGYIKG